MLHCEWWAYSPAVLNLLWNLSRRGCHDSVENGDIILSTRGRETERAIVTASAHHSREPVRFQQASLIGTESSTG